MKDSRLGRTVRERQGHLTPDAERLVAAALGLSKSGSRAEDDFWEAQLASRLEKMLDQGHNQAVFDAIERLNQTDLEAYGALVEAVENSAESVVINYDGQDWDVLLVAIPVVAWTRFKINSGKITPPSLEALSQIFTKEVAAASSRFVLAPYLYSVDQLPREFSELRKFTRKIGQAALQGTEFKLDGRSLPETADMLADVRFFLGALATPRQEALFRWQELNSPTYATRLVCLERWIASARSTIERLIPGCGFECLLPDAYHINLRESDRQVRPHGVRAAVNFLTHTLSIEPNKIRAYIASFGAMQTEEYRIGLSIDDSEQVAQGIVWPIFGPEDMQSELAQNDEPGPLETIKSLLRECGITEIRYWSNIEEPEFCEDCGAPMFPNSRGDIVHTEMPDEFEAPNIQLH